MFLCPAVEINSTDGGIPDDMDDACIMMISTTLHTTFYQKDIIDDSYSDAKNLLSTTADGYDFL